MELHASFHRDWSIWRRRLCLTLSCDDVVPQGVSASRAIYRHPPCHTMSVYWVLILVVLLSRLGSVVLPVEYGRLSGSSVRLGKEPARSLAFFSVVVPLLFEIYLGGRLEIRKIGIRPTLDKFHRII